MIFEAYPIVIVMARAIFDFIIILFCVSLTNKFEI